MKDALEMENAQLRAELSKANGIIEAQRKEMEKMKRKLVGYELKIPRPTPIDSPKCIIEESSSAATTPFRSPPSIRRGSANGSIRRGSANGSTRRGSANGSTKRGSANGSTKRGSAGGSTSIPSRSSASGSTPRRGSANGSTPRRGSANGSNTAGSGSAGRSSRSGSASGSTRRGSSSGGSSQSGDPPTRSVIDPPVNRDIVVEPKDDSEYSNITLPDAIANGSIAPSRTVFRRGSSKPSQRRQPPLPSTPEHTVPFDPSKAGARPRRASYTEIHVPAFGSDGNSANTTMADGSNPNTSLHSVSTTKISNDSEGTGQSASSNVVPEEPAPVPSRLPDFQVNDGQRVPIRTAIQGFPREGSIANHSDSDISSRESVPIKHEFSRTLEVENRPLFDTMKERGLYTGSMDRKTLMPDGYGCMKYHLLGREYEGDWEQGNWHGHGIQKNAAGDVYDGPFVHGQKEGPDATVKFGDGRSFKGRYQKDYMREGVLTFVDGSYYEGLLEDGKRNGFGMYCFQSGDHYEGQWQGDVMHGRGRMEWSDGTWYSGEWRHGIQHGFGTETNSDGTVRHSGNFIQGVPDLPSTVTK